MSLTKEDLSSIREIVHETVSKVVEEKMERKFEEFEVRIDAKIDDKLTPIRECMKQVLKAQIEIVDKIDRLENCITILSFNLNLTPSSRTLRTTLNDLH